MPPNVFFFFLLTNDSKKPYKNGIHNCTPVLVLRILTTVLRTSEIQCQAFGQQW